MAKALTLVLLLAGCSASGGSYCDIAKVHTFSAASIDALTAEEARQELTHNETIERLCGA